jgi:hypothetical protein
MSTTESVTLKFCVSSTDYSVPLGLRISVDHDIIYENAHVSSSADIKYPLSDDDGKHELTFELFGKLPEHTRLDEADNIVSDAVLGISNIEIDDIDIDQIVQFESVYTHDFNGTRSLQENKFYGSMGCNGTVRLKFTTPVYLWLLENM